MAVYTITLSQSGWTGSLSAIYYDTVSAAFYADSGAMDEITSIPIPEKSLYRFNGFYASSSASNLGDQYINANGEITAAFYALAITANKTIYASGTQVSFKLTISDQGGSGGEGSLFYRIDGGGFYRDYLCDTPQIERFTPPVRYGYEFKGYYSATSSGVQYAMPDGSLTESFDTLTASKTIYAQWQAPYKITISPNSGTGSVTEFYFGSISGRFYATTDVSAEPISKIAPHTRETFSLLGYYDANNTSSSRCVAPDGTISSGFSPNAAITLYCQWLQVSWRITFNKPADTGGTNCLYYRIDGGGYYLDDLATVEAEMIQPPERDGYVFKGYYAGTSSSSTQYIDADGSYTSSLSELAITAAKTFYAQWQTVHKITFSKSKGESGTDAIWYNPVDSLFYADAKCKIPAESITPPILECHKFAGYFNLATGTSQYIDADGEYTDLLLGLSITGSKTFYAQWNQISHKASLDDNGGAGGVGAFYFAADVSAFYADDQLTLPLDALPVPTRKGYDFLGYYSSATGGSRYVDALGEIAPTIDKTADVALYAVWSGREYVLAFDRNGGEGSAESITVKYGTAIGELPTIHRHDATFNHWTVKGRRLYSDSIWEIDSDATAIAVWQFYHGHITDYYALDGDVLACVESADGCTMSVIETSHGGHLAIQNADSDVGAYKIFGRQLNPVVTYRVIGRGSVTLTLGKAYGLATRSSSKVTIDGVSQHVIEESGFMLVAFEYRTGADKIPTLTLFGAANEGFTRNSSGTITPKLTDAINKWTVTLDVSPDHVAQDVFSAIDGGGELVSCTMRGECQPVVPIELGMPCASDVVQGKLKVSAQTAAYGGEDPPVAQSPFSAVQVNESNSDIDFISYNIRAERSLN